MSDLEVSQPGRSVRWDQLADHPQGRTQPSSRQKEGSGAKGKLRLGSEAAEASGPQQRVEHRQWQCMRVVHNSSFVTGMSWSCSVVR